jgi:predicted nucleic acid-binding protein
VRVASSSGPTDYSVIVETNWVLDVALRQDESAEALLALAREARITILLPSFCVTESIKALESKVAEWDRVAKVVDGIRADVERSTVLGPSVASLGTVVADLRRAADLGERELWSTLREVVIITQNIAPPTSETIRLTAETRESLRLSVSDSVVLATVMEVAATGTCKRFLSRDRGFDRVIVRELFERQGIEFHRDGRAIVARVERGATGG